jgi:hypothetical protein
MTDDDFITEEDKDEKLIKLSPFDYPILLGGFETYREYLLQFLSGETPTIADELESIKSHLQFFMKKVAEGGHTAMCVRGWEICRFKSMAELYLKKLQSERKSLLDSGVPEEAAEGIQEKIRNTTKFLDRSLFVKVQSATIIGKNHFETKDVESSAPRIVIKNRDGTVVVGDDNEIESKRESL